MRLSSWNLEWIHWIINRKGIALFVGCWLWSYPLLAQTGFSASPEVPLSTQEVVHFTTGWNPIDPHLGEYAQFFFAFTIRPGWHIYSVHPSLEAFAPPPTVFEMTMEGASLEGTLLEPVPIHRQDLALQLSLSFHEGTPIFFQNLKVAAVSPSSIKVSGSVRYQACSEKICLPPFTQSFEDSVTVGTGTIRPVFSKMVENSIHSSTEKKLLSSSAKDKLSEKEIFGTGFLEFLGLAVFAGLFALLTPCVFPMIPITVSFFTKQAHDSYRGTFRRTLWFGAGIVGTYAVVGMGLSVLLGASGALQLAANPWVNMFIGLLFCGFSLSLIGFFQLSFPVGLSHRVDQWARNSHGVVGIFLMGLAFTLTSFTCTVQFIGTLLVAASQGHWLWPLAGMITFASVFASPFLLLGWFPRWIHSLRSHTGEWLAHTKIVLGLVELGAAFKFLSNADLVWQWGLLDRNFLLLVWILLSALAGFFLLGSITIAGYRVKQTGVMGFSGALGFLFLSVYLAQGLGGTPLPIWIDSYLPPQISEASQADQRFQTTRLQPLHDLKEGLALAQAQQKKVLVDFTGYTCVNCRWMERTILEKSPVVEELQQNFVLVQLYTDGGKNAAMYQQMQLDRFHTVSLPFYVVLNAQDEVLATHTGVVSSPDEFLAFLRQLR